MATVQEHRTDGEQRMAAARAEARYEQWAQWPVHWSAVWVGTLASLAAMIIFGLGGLAVGAYLVEPGQRWVDTRSLGIATVVCAVLSAFFAFVIGGWVAGKIAGILRSEPAMLHGAVVWLVTTPLVMALVGMGAGTAFGAWYGGLATSSSAATAPYEHPMAPGSTASPTELEQYRASLKTYQERMEKWRNDTPRVARNGALGAVTALLLGLVGAVVGGWMASGEPMTFGYHRTRPAGTYRMTGERVQV